MALSPLYASVASISRLSFLANKNCAFFRRGVNDGKDDAPNLATLKLIPISSIGFEFEK